MEVVSEFKAGQKAPSPSLPGESPPPVAQRPHGLLECPQGDASHEAHGL